MAWTTVEPDCPPLEAVTVAAASRCVQNAVLNFSGAGTEGIAPAAHGNVVGIHSRGGDLHLAARQNIIVVGRNIKVTQFSAGLVGGHQENLITDGPLTAAGWSVNGFCGCGVWVGDGERGGAAAIQAQRGDAAQLDQSLGHLRHGCANGVPGLPPVNGVKHQRAVRLLAHGCARVHLGGKSGNHRAVLHQRVQRAHGVLHIHPVTAGGGRAQGHRGPAGIFFRAFT